MGVSTLTPFDEERARLEKAQKLQTQQQQSSLQRQFKRLGGISREPFTKQRQIIQQRGLQARETGTEEIRTRELAEERRLAEVEQGKQFESEQASLARKFQEEQAAKGRIAIRDEGEIRRAFDEKLAEEDRIAKKKIADEGLKSAEDIAEKNRISINDIFAKEQEVREKALLEEKESNRKRVEFPNQESLAVEKRKLANSIRTVSFINAEVQEGCAAKVWLNSLADRHVAIKNKVKENLGTDKTYQEILAEVNRELGPVKSLDRFTGDLFANKDPGFLQKQLESNRLFRHGSRDAKYPGISEAINKVEDSLINFSEAYPAQGNAPGFTFTELR